MRNTYKILVGNPEGNRLIERPRHKWEDNITKDPSEIAFGSTDWMHVAQDRDQ
jgi:hypothetical protein